MANRRTIVKRRKAVRNIRKITRTMQLIATARFQAAFNRATATKPYSEKLAEMVADLAAADTSSDHPLMRRPEDVAASDLVVITSSRGLAGGYNAGVLRTALEHIDERGEAGDKVNTIMVRKKGVNYFRFLKREMAETILGVGDMPSFDEVEPIAEKLMERFKAGEIASAHVAYMRFFSTSQQKPEVIQLLPLTREEGTREERAAGEVGEGAPAAGTSTTQPGITQPGTTQPGTTRPGTTQYEFMPDPQELLDELLPATVRLRLYQAFTDAAVSEQIARMVAMKSATTAAEDKIKQLTREYNRARQTAITMELLDIVGGANALG